MENMKHKMSDNAFSLLNNDEIKLQITNIKNRRFISPLHVPLYCTASMFQLHRKQDDTPSITGLMHAFPLPRLLLFRRKLFNYVAVVWSRICETLSNYYMALRRFVTDFPVLTTFCIMSMWIQFWPNNLKLE